jgi:orotidine-5'-phosphate decarboxylase
VLSCGPDMVNELSRVRPVICDFKIADIPNTCRLITELAFQRGAHGIIAHAFSGADSLEAIKGIADKNHGIVFTVVELTNPGAVESYGDSIDRLIRIALKAGIKGFIAPGTRPDKIKRIRERAGPEAVILSPGIGAQGGDGKKAIESGADYIIVGRSIYNAEDPEHVAEKIVNSLR